MHPTVVTKLRTPQRIQACMSCKACYALDRANLTTTNFRKLDSESLNSNPLKRHAEAAWPLLHRTGIHFEAQEKPCVKQYLLNPITYGGQ